MCNHAVDEPLGFRGEPVGMVETILVSVLPIKCKIEFRLNFARRPPCNLEEADEFTWSAGIEAFGNVMH